MTQVPPQAEQQLQPLQGRGMAVWVDVENNNLEKALGQLNRKVSWHGMLNTH